MHTILYINPLTPAITFLIFDGINTIEQTLAKDLNTASTLPGLLVEIVDKYQIKEIYCVTGPGPFTLMRMVTLAINTLTYTRDIRVKSCHFFDLIPEIHIALIEANPREYLMRRKDDIETLSKEDITPGIYEGTFSEAPSTGWIKLIQYKDKWDHIYSIFSSRETLPRISPIYFKPPHITWSHNTKAP